MAFHDPESDFIHIAIFIFNAEGNYNLGCLVTCGYIFSQCLSNV